jgi:hypothetical protein
MLRDDDAWSEVTIEPDDASEKVDIRWAYANNRIKAVQVKSSQNQITLPQARAWAEALETNVAATEYELVLIGSCADSVLKCSPIRKVSVPPPLPLNLKAFREQSAHQLHRYLDGKGFSGFKPQVLELLVEALVTRLFEFSTKGSPLARSELDQSLNEWILELYPHATHRDKKRFWSAIGWKPITAIAAVLLLLLAFVEQRLDLSGLQFDRSDFETSIPPEEVDVMRGELFNFDVRARNSRRHGTCSIRYLPPAAAPEKGIDFAQVYGTYFPGVPPGSDTTFRISGKAVRAGDYKVTIKGIARAGLIRREIPFEQSVDVRVWLPWSIGTRTVKQISPDGKRCEAEFEFRPGRRYARGLKSEAKVERLGRVRIRFVRFPGTDQFEPFEEWDRPGKEVAILDWNTGEIRAMRVISFTLMIETDAEKGKTLADWECLVQKIHFSFNELHEEAD